MLKHDENGAKRAKGSWIWSENVVSRETFATVCLASCLCNFLENCENT